MNTSAFWLGVAGWGAVAGAAIHISTIFGGPVWYAFLRAPPAILQSAIDGTWLAPLSTLAIALGMLFCATYAFSAAGHLRKLPGLKTVLFAVASLCLLRAFALLPIGLWRPELIDGFEVIASTAWLLIGIGFAVGFLLHRRRPSATNSSP